MQVIVENVKLRQRFQAEVEGVVAFLEYKIKEGKIILIHTKVPQELEGKGIGSQLAKTALDYAENQGLKVDPQCPFVSSYIDRHKEYMGLVEH